MQAPPVRPALSASTRKSSGASNGTKNKKKKALPPPKSVGNISKEAAAPVGPQPVVPPPLSGPWGKAKPVSSSTPPPGFCPTSSPSTRSDLSDTHVRLLRHRALFAFRFLVGKAVELHLVASNERYTGILDCVDPDDFSIVLKCTKRLSSSCTDAKPFDDGSTVIFRRHQLVHLVADGTVNYTDGVFASGTTAVSNGFRTDTEISQQKGEHLYGRELETASSWLDPALGTGALEDSESQGRRKSSGKAGWNQFEANEKLFGVVSTFDENIYTTKLDKSKISTEQSLAAEKLAYEIERQSAAGNFHLQEERGQMVRSGKHGNDFDEETRYSSVDRRIAPRSDRAYVPPALRNTQSQSSGDKPQDMVTHSVAPIVKSPPSAEKNPPAVAPAVHKPLSFSEAVTGRSTATTVAPTNQSNEKKEVTALFDAEQESGKDVETADRGKKSAHEQDRGHESEDQLSPRTTVTDEAPKLKKGLNPNAKEFKLNAAAAPFTPSFSEPLATKQHMSLPYRGSPSQMPYLHPGTGYPLPLQEEWMYEELDGDGGGELGLPPYGYGVPMGPNGVPILYPPMIPQQTMRMVGGQSGGYGYQPGYTPRGYYSPPPNGFPPYAGGPLVSPPLPPTPSGNKTLFADAADDAIVRSEATASDVVTTSLDPSSASE